MCPGTPVKVAQPLGPKNPIVSVFPQYLARYLANP